MPSLLVAASIGVATAGATPAARAVAPSAKKKSKKKSSSKPTKEVAQVRELNRRAQKAYDNNEFQVAATAWSEILTVLPETKANRVERETALLVALDAYTRAWHESGSEKEGEALEAAVEALGVGVATFEGYEATYREAYGDDAVLPDAAEQAGKEIRQWHTEAKDKLPKPPPPPPAKPEVADPAPEPVAAAGSNSTSAGTGLILGGAVVAASGVGAVSMIVAGSIMGRRASRDSAMAETQEQLDSVNQRGMTGNALVISGVVATGVLVLGGTTMLVLGLHRRKGALAVAPSIGPRFAGGTVRVSF